MSQWFDKLFSQGFKEFKIPIEIHTVKIFVNIRIYRYATKYCFELEKDNCSQPN